MNNQSTQKRKVNDFSFGKLNDKKEFNRFLQKLDKRIAQYEIALMPDVHLKEKLESPSSAAYAIKDFFSLKLTSPSPNCGMSFALTPLAGSEINDAGRLAAFFSEFCDKIPLNRKDKILSKDQVYQILSDGAKVAADVVDMDPEQLDNCEFRGNIFNQNKIVHSDPQEVIPDFLIELSQYRFGILGGGNHFLEFQQVEEIYDPEVATVFGLLKGQGAVLFHTGSEAMGSLIGRVYAQRKKTSLKMNARLLPSKIKFHLKSQPLGSMYKYFSPRQLTFFPANDSNFSSALQAYYSAFNFGYANRFFILNSIKKALAKAFETDIELRLLLDTSHNSILYEQIRDEHYWVHRHNSSRIAPRYELNSHPVFSHFGQPLLISGTNQTPSYLCVPGLKPERSLNSIDHGFGNLLNGAVKAIKFSDKKITTKMYNYGLRGFQEHKLINDELFRECIQYLEKEEIVKAVAQLRPIATLKGPKPRIN